MRNILKCLVVMAMFSGPLHAEDLAVESRIYVETRDGTQRTLSEGDMLRRGDRVIAIIDWSAARLHSPIITSAVPAQLSFLDTSIDDVELSRDGGRSWQRADSNTGGRVTHLRWRTGGKRRLAYSAIVR